MSHKKDFLRYTWPAVLWAAVIFVGSSIPSKSMPSFAFTVEDLVWHFLEYAIFGVLLALAYVRSPGRASFKTVGLAVLTGVLYAASDEWHQSFVPGRVTSLADFLADAAGVVFGVVAFVALPRLAVLLGLRKRPAH